MRVFWFVAAALTLATLIVVLWPLIRTPRPGGLSAGDSHDQAEPAAGAEP